MCVYGEIMRCTIQTMMLGIMAKRLGVANHYSIYKELFQFNFVKLSYIAADKCGIKSIRIEKIIIFSIWVYGMYLRS